MKLYGVPISNYYNIVKLALLEKGLDFEEVLVIPGRTEGIEEHSPLGKIPYFQHGQRYFSESQAILFYLEVYQPMPRLYPTSPGQAARAQQIHQFIDCYLDPLARRLMPMAFFGAEKDQAVIDKTSEEMRRVMRALNGIIRVSPYIAGETLTHADLAALMTFGLAQGVCAQLGTNDPLAQLPGIGVYEEMMEQRPSVQRVRADQARAMEELFGR